MASFHGVAELNADASPHVITTPAGTAIGDVALVGLFMDTVGGTFNAPDGTWTEVDAYNAADVTWRLFYKQFSGAPAATYTFTESGGATSHCRMVIIRPGAGETFVGVTDAFTNGVTESTLVTPNLSNESGPRVLTAWFGSDTNFTETTAPTGMTRAGTFISTSGGVSLTFATYYEVNPSGTPLSRTLVLSGSDLTIKGLALVHFTSAAGPITGDASISLPLVTLSAAGALALQGAASISLPLVTVSAAGAVAVQGAAALTLPLVQVSAVGSLAVQGEAAISLPLVQTSGAGGGVVGIAGDASLILPAVTISATGTLAIQGAAAIVLPMIRITASEAPPVEADYLTGRLTVRPALTGRLTVRPTLTGTLTVRPG